MCERKEAKGKYIDIRKGALSIFWLNMHGVLTVSSQHVYGCAYIFRDVCRQEYNAIAFLYLRDNDGVGTYRMGFLL